jgi:2-keto-4-pentenoate hydratase/2-oxohepta-3-ene-1,7-dioic acid hydratase in catechol pathway
VEGDTVYELRGDPYRDCGRGAMVGPFDRLTILAPCKPETIWSLGANYPSRCAERGFELPEEPGFAVVTGTCISGPDADIRIPEHEVRSEYGAELGVMMRRDCRDVEEDEADEYILGYTGLNNIWTKDAAGGDYVRPLRVYDTYCPTGPVVDTELEPENLRIRLWVDGHLRQDDRTSTVVFPARHVVSWLSKRVEIKRGDLIMTGSPGGIEGHTLKHGQTVEMEVEGIGRLRNRVVRVDNAAVSYVVSLKRWLAMQEPGGAGAPQPGSYY